jgi:CRP-like cAMP-binding protein
LEDPLMGTDALQDLRAWQREQASQQDKALRTARRAQQVIDDLDTKRAAAVDGLALAVAGLEKTGLSREQCAAFLDMTPEELSRATRGRRRTASPKADETQPATAAKA